MTDSLGIDPQHIQPWGPGRAKVSLDAMRPPTGKLVLVSAITPVGGGEGKTTMTIALAMGLQRRGRNAMPVLRQPSLGPIFGKKGGGSGGGRSTVEPSTAINLHFTGDIHAVGAAHGLLAAMVDSALYFREDIDPRTITWPRVTDMNDRALRRIVVGLGDAVRETRFDITAASEVMAVLCLARDPADLLARLGRLRVGRRRDGTPVTAKDLGVDGAMAAVLNDALLPNLVSTSEGGPALIHGGPFANIAQGCNSVIATRMGLGLADIVTTEAGFGFDLGGEKFLDLKCPVGDVWPSAVMLVVTLSSLRTHGGGDMMKGLPQVDHHVASVRRYGLPVIVCINRFPADTDAEIAAVATHVAGLDVQAVPCDAVARGGEGAEAIADALLGILGTAPTPWHPYALTDKLEKKLTSVAMNLYGADGVDFLPAAVKQLAELDPMNLPICVAKTPSSLTGDSKLPGVPKGFRLTVRELRLMAGAGFIVAVAGDIETMPGLPRDPAARRIGVGPDGRVFGV